MSNIFWLSDAQMARVESFIPKSHGRPRVDDWLALSGLVFINCNGWSWRRAQGAWPVEHSLQPLETMERQMHLPPDDGCSDDRSRCTEDGDAQCELSHGAPHGNQPAVEKGAPATRGAV
jgi:hypothetical protein